MVWEYIFGIVFGINIGNVFYFEFYVLIINVYIYVYVLRKIILIMYRI